MFKEIIKKFIQKLFYNEPLPPQPKYEFPSTGDLTTNKAVREALAAPVLSAGPITPEMANWSEADKAKLISVITQYMSPQPLLPEHPAHQEPVAFVPKDSLSELSGGVNHVTATLTLNDDNGKAVAVYK
jgi:hypothetical protein